MSTTTILRPGNQLWGIYHTDREYARVMGDPLRTIVEALTKLAAEEAAARLGFSDLRRDRGGLACRQPYTARAASGLRSRLVLLRWPLRLARVSMPQP